MTEGEKLQRIVEHHQRRGISVTRMVNETGITRSRVYELFKKDKIKDKDIQLLMSFYKMSSLDDNLPEIETRGKALERIKAQNKAAEETKFLYEVIAAKNETINVLRESIVIYKKLLGERGDLPQE